MYEDLLMDFDGKKIKLEEIRCTELPKYEKYTWYPVKNEKNNNKEYLILGTDLNEKLTYDEHERTFNNASALKDVVKLGEYVYKNFKKDNKHNNPIFLKNEKEALELSNYIITNICYKYGIPVTKKNHFEIYDFAFFCYDLYTRFCAWLLLNQEDDIEKIKIYLGKDVNYLKTKKDIKAHIVPTFLWDYLGEPVTVHFYYDKEKDKYKKFYECKNLKDLTLLQFNLLFFSKDGLVSKEGNLINIKQCEYCGKEFVTTTMQKKYCDNCKKLRQAERKRKSREKAKKNKQ